MTEYSFSDGELARRLERAESAANASFVDARSRITPETGALWIDVDGTWAMFDGVGSPLTQTFGFGLFSTPLDEQLEAIEHFFESRKSHVHHEISPMADPAHMSVLSARGYRPLEQSTVLHRPLSPEANPQVVGGVGEGVSVRVITPQEIPLWAETSALGWSHYPELGDFMREMGAVIGASRHTTCFVAVIDGAIAATGAMSMHEGVALLAGASTVPQYRNRGAQNALLQARLSFAVMHGADLAMMVASPGSASQRNAERQGFRVAYTRTKWEKA